MARRELISDIKASVGFAAVTVTDNTATNTGIIDTAGYQSIAFLIQTGTLADADATFAITLTAGDDSGLSDGAAVTSAEYVGDTSFTFADDGTVKKIAYLGGKRYVRATVTPSNNTGNAPLACTVFRGHAGVKAIA
jgi:hypothetical protein